MAPTCGPTMVDYGHGMAELAHLKTNYSKNAVSLPALNHTSLFIGNPALPPLLQPVLVIIPTSPWRPPSSPQIAQSCSKRRLQKGPSPVTLAILRGSECASVCPLWAIKGHRYIPTGCQYDAALGRLSIPQRAQAAPPTQLWNFGATLIIAWNTPSLHKGLC